MLETYGLLSAVEGLDAALKSANVILRSFDYVSGGLIAWFVEGEVGAVRVAVSAGKAAASRVGDVVSDHVIARPAEDVVKELKPPGRPGGRKGGIGIHKRDFAVNEKQRNPTPKLEQAQKKAAEQVFTSKQAMAVEQVAAHEQGTKPKQAIVLGQVAAPEQAPRGKQPRQGQDPEKTRIAEQKPLPEGNAAKKHTLEELKALGVYELRAIARQTDGIKLKRIEIRDAKKNALINSILEAEKQ
jgi:ethanolamine utilization protein EutM